MDNYRNGQLGSYRCNNGYNWQKWDILYESGMTAKLKNVRVQKKKCLIPGGKEANCNDERALWILGSAKRRKRRQAENTMSNLGNGQGKRKRNSVESNVASNGKQTLKEIVWPVVSV